MSKEDLCFSPGSKIEAKDFNEKWHSAKVVETDWSEGEVLVHFDESKFDEWIPMDSSRFRRHCIEPKFTVEESTKVDAIATSEITNENFQDETSSNTENKQDRKRKSGSELFHPYFRKTAKDEKARMHHLNCIVSCTKYIPKSKSVNTLTESNFIINNYQESKDISDGQEENYPMYTGSLQIKYNVYKCPKSGCNKNFRKDSLLQMHLKYYHPEYSKFFSSLPNVVDLAYARTNGKSVEDFPKKSRIAATIPVPNLNNMMQNYDGLDSDSQKEINPNHSGNFSAENEIINCTCGYQGEDGLMIQCDLCLCWQHSYCNNIEKEEDVPEKYVCYICKNSHRQRSSKKYFNEQDWIREGKLPSLNEYSTESFQVKKRTAMLKRSYDLISVLLKIQSALHSLRAKLEILHKKDHPKLYLWAKNWTKRIISSLKMDPVPVMEIIKDKNFNDSLFDENTNDFLDVSFSNPFDSNDTLIKSDSELIQILEEENEVSKPTTDCFLSNKSIPQPEAPIDLVECKQRLLEHFDNFQNYLDKTLNFIEVQVSALENMKYTESNAHVEPEQTNQTLQMLIRDLESMKKLAAC